MKTYVLLVWALDTALNIVQIHSTYTLFVTNFSNVLALLADNVSVSLSIIC